MWTIPLVSWVWMGENGPVGALSPMLAGTVTGLPFTYTWRSEWMWKICSFNPGSARACRRSDRWSYSGSQGGGVVWTPTSAAGGTEFSLVAGELLELEPPL